ncbi:hypothetical protein J2Y03_000328 [Neobacillus niacini]|nr:hypothetical protein [Neobacillus niacini]
MIESYIALNAMNQVRKKIRKVSPCGFFYTFFSIENNFHIYDGGHIIPIQSLIK